MTYFAPCYCTSSISTVCLGSQLYQYSSIWCAEISWPYRTCYFQ